MHSHSLSGIEIDQINGFAVTAIFFLHYRTTFKKTFIHIYAFIIISLQNELMQKS